VPEEECLYFRNVGVIIELNLPARCPVDKPPSRYPPLMPSATFTETVSIDAAPDEVWDRLQEPSIWQSVGPVQKVWDPTIEDGVLQTFKWSTNIGGKVYKGEGKALQHSRPAHYELLLDTSEMSGTISVDLTSGNPGGTSAVVSIELKSKGMLSSMFFPAIRKAVGSGFPEFHSKRN